MMKVLSLKQAPTTLLKAVLLVLGVIALSICIFAFPLLWSAIQGGLPEYAYVIYPAFIGLYLTVLPFLFALYQAFTLLLSIDTNRPFSQESIRALRNIKYAALLMSAFYALALPMALVIAELDDAPGLGAVALTFVCAPIVVATFAAVLQKLLQSGLALKQENDLTI